MSKDLSNIINSAYAQINHIHSQNVDAITKEAVCEVIQQLDDGQLRVAEKKNNAWQINEWIKKAILLYFKLSDSQLMEGGFNLFFDKIPSKYIHYNQTQFKTAGTRVVPPAFVRKGAYIAASTVLMPSFVNIGAYIDTGTMIDTWSTVGSCNADYRAFHVNQELNAAVSDPEFAQQINKTYFSDQLCFLC